MNHNAQEKIEIAIEFETMHKSPVCEWAPHFENSDKQHLAIYQNLVAGEYGEIHERDGASFIEIGANESFSGRPVEFEITKEISN